MSKQDILSSCDRCGGTGSESGTNPETQLPIENPCPKCGGSGNITTGFLSQELVENIESTKAKVDWLKKNVKELLKHFNIDEK